MQILSNVRHSPEDGFSGGATVGWLHAAAKNSTVTATHRRPIETAELTRKNIPQLLEMSPSQSFFSYRFVVGPCRNNPDTTQSWST
ncbi:MAG: hypothetical protein DMG42_13995 [Acidobacteria bacterium]|nr:MAG: hypothetical protein DMG42_13995 [Acidobacteriota bacterium]